MVARLVVLCSMVGCSLSAADPGLNQIRSVYLLPMSGGLDQYLANKIVREGRFHVVTDPARAEAVFTDRLGVDFEARMTELYPPPPTPEELAKKEKEKDAKDERESRIGDALSEVSGQGAGRVSSLSRGRGNIFLVDRASRQVVWSYFQRPKSSASMDMDRTASDISGKLHAEAKRVLKASAEAEKIAIEKANQAPVAPVPPPAPVAAPATAPAPAPEPAKQ